MSRSGPPDPSASSAPTARPNVLLIMADQMRADHLGATGAEGVRTPNLDRLAEDGVAVTRAYVANPVCMPSRATLFTGRTPRGHGVRCNGIPLDPSQPTLPERLRQAGYRTASFGKVHLEPYERYDDPPGRAPTSRESHQAWAEGRIEGVPVPYFGLQEVALTIGHGTDVEGDYARWLRHEHPDAWTRLRDGARPAPSGAEGCGRYPLPEDMHHSHWVADRTIAFLEDHAADAPFFAICSFPDPHHPYVPPAPWDGAYDPASVPLPIGRPGELDALHPLFRDMRRFDAWVSGRRRPTDLIGAHVRDVIAHTYGMVGLLDAQVGRLLEVLERRDLRRDTVVVFLSDHGDLLGDHGLLNKGPFHFESLLRVPMIWSWPDRFPPRRTAALASLLDVVPTLLELTGCNALAAGPREGVQAQPPELPGTSLRPVLEGRSDAVQSAVVVENDEDYLGLRLRTLITAGAKVTTYTDHDGPVPHGELFDLADDPYELHNRWRDPAYADRKAELIAGLHHALVRTDDATTRRTGHA